MTGYNNSMIQISETILSDLGKNEPHYSHPSSNWRMVATVGVRSLRFVFWPGDAQMQPACGNSCWRRRDLGDLGDLEGARNWRNWPFCCSMMGIVRDNYSISWRIFWAWWTSWYYMWRSDMGVPQNGWFMKWNMSWKWMIWGYHRFRKPPYYIAIQIEEGILQWCQPLVGMWNRTEQTGVLKEGSATEECFLGV